MLSKISCKIILILLKKNMGKKVQVPEKNKFVDLDAYQRLIDSDVDVVLLDALSCFRPQHLTH